MAKTKFIAWSETVEQAKQRVKRDFKNNYLIDKNSNIDFDIDGTTYTFDFPNPIENQADLASMCSGTGISPIAWTDIDGVVRITTSTNLKRFNGALVNRGLTLYAKLKAKKQEVDNATTLEQINAINWE